MLFLTIAVDVTEYLSQDYTIEASRSPLKREDRSCCAVANTTEFHATLTSPLTMLLPSYMMADFGPIWTANAPFARNEIPYDGEVSELTYDQ
jgi:hypothetical protein